MITSDQIVFLEGENKESVLQEMVQTAASFPQVIDPLALLKAIMDREKLYTTAIGLGIAVPHARVSAVTDTLILMGRSRRPIPAEALDGEPVSLFVLIAVPPDQHKAYIRTLARVARFLKDANHRESIANATDIHEMAQILEAM